MEHHEEELTPQEMAEIELLLSNENVWAEPSPGLEDVVAATISSEVKNKPLGLAPPIDGPLASEPPSPTAGITQIETKRRSSRWSLSSAVLGAAAAFILLVGGLVASRSLQSEPDFQNVALAATDASTGASGVARVETQANGVRILLDVKGLSPAPEGSFYQAWLVRSDPKQRVSAGTFHFRGGDGEIELWSGVSTETYNLMTVTLQPESAPDSPGVLVLSGPIT